MGFIEDVSTLSGIRDDVNAKDAAVATLLALVVKYAGDASLAQSFIDADTALQALLVAAIAPVGTSVAATSVVAVALPDFNKQTPPVQVTPPLQ